MYLLSDSYTKSTCRYYLPPPRNEADKRSASFENTGVDILFLLLLWIIIVLHTAGGLVKLVYAEPIGFMRALFTFIIINDLNSTFW